jgi:hypothetical protein
MGNATNSSSEETAKAKRVKLETTRGADNAIAHRKEDNSSRNINAGGSSNDSSSRPMAVRAVQRSAPQPRIVH